MKIEENERVEDLQLNGLKIIQKTNGYNFTSDSALLANFVSAKKTDYCLEIGCGSGVISILVNEKCSPKKIFAVEIQEEMANLAKKNVELNNLLEKIEIINTPIQNYQKYFKGESFDVVFTNPPYLEVVENSLLKQNLIKAQSRHEVSLKLSELVYCANKNLKFGGKFFIVYRTERLVELFCELKKNMLEPKRMFLVAPNIEAEPNIVILEARKGAKKGLKILPTLITNDKNGNYLFTIQKLYREMK